MRIVHFLKKNINDIVWDLEEIKRQGFDAIQISSVQPFKDQYREHEWYMLYQPLAFSIGNVYGSRDDLINLCNKAREFGLKIIVDVVCNHTANLDDYNPLTPHPDVDINLRNNPYFWKEKKEIYPDDWKDREKVTHRCMGLPGLEAANYELQDIIGNFLNDLVECGVAGFRFDAAKSIALPEEHFNNYPDCHFWSRILKEKLGDKNLFNYGEVIFPDNEEQIRNYQKYMNVLTNYQSENTPDVVTFYESHDTFLGHGDLSWSKGRSEDEVCNGYVDTTRRFDNTLFFNRPNTEMWRRDDVKRANNCRVLRR